DPKVGHRVTGEHAALDRLCDTRLDGRGMLLGDFAGRCTILVDVAAAPIGRLDHELDVAVLAARPRRPRGRAHQLVLALGAPGDGLAIRDLRVAHARPDPELAAHALDDDLEVELA